VGEIVPAQTRSQGLVVPLEDVEGEGTVRVSGDGSLGERLARQADYFVELLARLHSGGHIAAVPSCLGDVELVAGSQAFDLTDDRE
jgi:hypothetical protein